MGSKQNKYYPEVVEALLKAGHQVYDFRNSPHGGNGFHWTDIDENAPNWTFEQYAKDLHHPLAEKQFTADLEALEWAAPASWFFLAVVFVRMLTMLKALWWDRKSTGMGPVLE